MMGRRRKFTPEFKAQVVLEVISGRRTAAEMSSAQERATTVV